jgi:hypothetical protein
MLRHFSDEKLESLSSLIKSFEQISVFPKISANQDLPEFSDSWFDGWCNIRQFRIPTFKAVLRL